MSYQKELSIIIPAYNEENRIKKTLFAIQKYFNKQNIEIIVVNDGSSDNSLKILESLKNKILSLKIISYKKNQGKGYAVQQGINSAIGKYILFLDADNSTPISEYNKLYSALNNGTELAIGSRHLSKSNIIIKQSILRILISRIGNYIIRLLLVKNIHDTQCGFKLFKNQSAKIIFSKQTIKGWGFDMEILAIAQILGYKIKEIPVNWLNTKNSSFRPVKDTWQTLKELITIKRNIIKNKYAPDF